MIEKIKYHFDAAHRLSDYKGKCHNLHGHRWEVEVIISGTIDQTTGMIIDFGIIKKVIDQFDHITILKDNYKNRILYNILTHDLNSKCMLIKNEPTVENIVKIIYNTILKKVSPFKVRIKLWESPGCGVEYGDEIKD